MLGFIYILNVKNNFHYIWTSLYLLIKSFKNKVLFYMQLLLWSTLFEYFSQIDLSCMYLMQNNQVRYEFQYF